MSPLIPKLNKKAVIDRFLTGFVSIIGVVIIIGLFIAASSILSKTKGAGESLAPAKIYASPSENLFLQAIEINVKEGEKTTAEKMLVADAIIYSSLGKIGETELRNSLKKLLNNEGTCLGLAFGNSERAANIENKWGALGSVVISYESKNGKVGIPEGFLSKTFKAYGEKGNLQKITLSFLKNGKKENVYAESFYGECLEVKDE
jgi:hypothetical protein